LCQLTVTPLPETFGQFIERSFDAIRGGVAASPVAALVMFDALRDAAIPLPDRRRKDMLREQGRMLYEQACNRLDGPDLHRVEERYTAFRRDFAG
jgi:hypothetical protein